MNIFETCDIDTDALDRNLCNVLGIEGVWRPCMCEGQTCDPDCSGGATTYPKFSGENSGVYKLIKVLDANKIIWNMENLQDGRGVTALCLRNIKHLGHVDYIIARTPQLALALAAAKALEIPIPRKKREPR